MKRILPAALLLAACDGQPTTDDDAVITDDEICGIDAPTGLAVGDCAPEFSLLDRNGTAFTLSSQRGKVALVDISALW